MKFALVLSTNEGADVHQYSRKMLEEWADIASATEENKMFILKFAKEARVGDTLPFRGGIIFAIADSAQIGRFGS